MQLPPFARISDMLIKPPSLSLDPEEREREPIFCTTATAPEAERFIWQKPGQKQPRRGPKCVIKLAKKKEEEEGASHSAARRAHK